MISALDSATIDFPKNGGRTFICNIINQYQEFHKEKSPNTE